MSKPRYIWWGYAKAVVQQYPRASKSAEMQPICKRREVDAVANAIKTTREIPGGALRMRLIRMVYWDRSHTLDGAALKLGIHPQTAKNWHGDFIRLVGRNLGLLDGVM